MKHLIALVALCMASALTNTCWANDILVVEKTNGNKSIYVDLDSLPIVTFTEEGLNISAGNTLIAFSDVDYVHFTTQYTKTDKEEEEDKPEIPTEVNTPEEEITPMEIQVRGGQLNLSGCQPNSPIFIYGIDGKLLLKGQMDGNGNIQMDMHPFGSKIVIVKTTTESFKIKI